MTSSSLVSRHPFGAGDGQEWPPESEIVNEPSP